MVILERNSQGPGERSAQGCRVAFMTNDIPIMHVEVMLKQRSLIILTLISE